jgi:pilus assembly protein FimV
MLLASGWGVQAAGLGALSVYSGIGQQLNAEVALNATPAELSSMSARLASPEAFKEAGIEWMPALADLRIKIEKSAAGQPVLKLTTNRPVTEPFLHFLVELSWSSGRVIREYTFLLDPPEMLQPAKPASVVAPAAPAPEPLPAQAALASPAPAITKPVAPSASEYQVKAGDTLAKIARETRPESVTLDQMLVALFEKNPEAFAGGNMNRLRAGKILRIPAAEEVSKVDPAAARKLVISQTSEFDAYRRRLAAAVASAPAPSAEALPRQQASGAIKPQVEDKTPVAPAQDKLEVSRTEPAKAKQTPGGGLEEELIARDKALREAAERIAQLEKNIENLKKLVEIKSQTGAALQQPSEPVAPATKPVEPQPPAPATKPVEPQPPAPKAEEAKPSAPADVTPAKPVEPAPATAAGPAPQPAKPATPPPAAKKPAAPPPPEEEPSFVAENPELVYGGGVIALLLAYLGYASWRRKKAAVERPAMAAAESVSVTPPAESKPAPSAPAAGLESGEISIQDEFSEGGLLTSEEIVDPVAEAEVLMAYGRDRQAEEVLQAGLAKDPTRPAIHMKLLELYAKQEDLSQFEAVANKLYPLVNGRGEDWERVVQMAHRLGLFGGIFAASAAVAAAMESPAPAEGAAPTPTIEPLQPPPESELAHVAEPTVSQEAAPVASEEMPSLDFELDLSLPVEEEQAITEPLPTAQATAPEPDIALDFDLGAPEAEQAVNAAVEKAEAATTEPAPVLDFELDVGSPVEEVAEESRQAEPEAPLDIEFDFDLSPVAGTPAGETPESSASGELPSAAAQPEIPESVPPLPGIADLNLDFDLELDETPTDKVSPAVSEAQSGAGVSIAPASAGETGIPTDELVSGPSAAPEAFVAAPSTSAEPEPDNVEAATKLELAEAYEEMGDLEGARELLNEVLNEGSAAQQALAKAKLEKLAAS